MFFHRKDKTRNRENTATEGTETPLNEKKKSGKATRNKLVYKTKPYAFVYIAIAFFLCLITLIGVMFVGLLSYFSKNTLNESALHLKEINSELQLYIEAKIYGDWNTTHGIVNGIESGIFEDDDAILNYIKQERDIWNVSNIIIYTESGYTGSTDGKVFPNDEASETVSNIKRQGEYLSIKESTIIFVTPIETDTLYHSSKILAVSVVQDLGSFLDNMNITSFSGSAFFYLTQINGVVISKLTHENAPSVYNLLQLLNESDITPISETRKSIEDPLVAGECTVFLRNMEEGDQYIVSTSVHTGYEEMRLFYFVPVNVVNQATNVFSHYIVWLSIIVMVAFSVGMLILFLYFYQNRKREFNTELSVRENIMSLLVQNSKSAFALLTINQKEPHFMSGNAERIIGEKSYNLELNDSKYRIVDLTQTNSSAIEEINKQLMGWNGQNEFRSTFIRNTSAPTPSYFELQIFPVQEKTQKGNFIAIAQDVTPLYERQTAASNALAYAEQANLAKTQFLSNMSHDIRTPMNAIINMTNFAKESINDSQKLSEYLDCLSESSAHLLRLINDVLDMSRIESGKMVISADTFDIMSDLKRIADIVRPLCEEKQQRFETDFSTIQVTDLVGDETKLSQILMNLLSNANKFTQNGGHIRFVAEELPSLRDNVVSMRFTVEDTGLGISEENIQKIFEPFTRVENKTVNKIEGTSLGLSICRSYINAMGGTIKCESQLGKGSIFTVELYFKRAENTQKAKIALQQNKDAAFNNKRCLLCEDNDINRIISTKLLTNLGFSVETAINGKEGSEKFALSSNGYYDIIYMDVLMPVMDGYEATAAIRKSAHPQAKSIPIIAMTANVFAEDIEHARSAGMNGHLGKPILVPELIQTTYAVLTNNHG